MHTTLHEAARSQEHLARFLTARGGALDGRDERGATPLHHALHAGLGSVLVPTPAWTLLALGASADLPDLDGTRPLHLACRGARRDVVWLLRCCGAEAARVDGAGRTPEDLVPQAARAVILPLLREPPPVARRRPRHGGRARPCPRCRAGQVGRCPREAPRRWPLVADVGYGVAITQGNWRIAIARYHRTREFRGQDEIPVYGTITVGRKF